MAISTRATGEAKLKNALAELDTQWKEFCLVVEPYKNRDNVYILSAIDDLYQFLDEALAQINMIRGNQYKAVIETQAEQLRKELNTLNNVVEQILLLQKAWIY